MFSNIKCFSKIKKYKSFVKIITILVLAAVILLGSTQYVLCDQYNVRPNIRVGYTDMDVKGMDESGKKIRLYI